ncbi:MAG TPA: integrin alpha, partial [Anaerolineae bacterium]|nr:integrin alpha [Anaerolineae bacterium]
MKVKALTLVTLAMALSMVASTVFAAPSANDGALPVAQAPSLNDAASAAPTPAQDVPADWWTAVQEDIRQSEYEITWQEQTALADLAAGYQAPNRAQNLRTYFTPEGIRVIPRDFDGETPPWEWGLTLTGYGYENGAQPVDGAVLTASGSRIDLARGALTEWYVNQERGLKHGFTLVSPPAGSLGAGTTIVLEMAQSGDLQANLTAAGDAVEWTTPGGVRVLRYAELLVTDASGRDLPARFSLSPGTISLVVDAADAVYPITVDPLATSPNWTAESDQAGARFGWSVGTAGDVNGDGYADVIVGARYFDNGQTDEGRAFVYLGSAVGLGAAPVWTAESDQANASFGHPVGTAGDVNGDGYTDVIVGAQWYTNGQASEGRAYVYHGSAAGLAAAPAWTAESNQVNALFGGSVGTAGDVNGDGYADVIVGATYFDNGQTDEGRAFVYHGGAAGLSASPAWTAESNQADAYFGSSVGTAGDVNGDGYADVVVSATFYDAGQTDEGRAFVYHGGAAGLSASLAWTAESDQDSPFFGISVGTAGDVNGDGYADVVVGAHFYDNGQTDEGAAFVYHGGAAGLSASPAWTAESDQASARFGYSVGTAGDVNGDGYADVLVGAYRYDNGQTDEGAAFVYYGGAAGLSAAQVWTAESDQADAQFGTSVGTAGDVNGDGYADVIVGAYFYDNGEADEGAAYVYHGGAAGLSAAPAWTAESDQASARFGGSVGPAGDVNGDGYADVIVGAYRYDNGQTDEGRAFVYHGGAAGLGALAAWTAESDQADAQFGLSVRTAGDVNGDGYADVVVGAYAYDNGQTDEGAAFVYHGGAAGLGVAPAWTAESDQADARFGWSVGTAGDVNGDGYADVIVGARYFDNGQTDEGRAFVYHGSAAGLSASPVWTAESDQANASFGHPVGTAGDVNGDGYADVIVGALWYTNGQASEGRAYVYHGGAAGLSAAPAWTAESNQVNALFGGSV